MDDLTWLPIPNNRKSNEPELVLARSRNNDLLIGRLKYGKIEGWWCEAITNAWITADTYIPVEQLLNLKTK